MLRCDQGNLRGTHAAGERDSALRGKSLLTVNVPLVKHWQGMQPDDERRPLVLLSMGSIRQLFASRGMDLDAYTDSQVADALLATCPPILGSQAWLNEKHLLRTLQLLRMQFNTD
jgi:hypothetical protein